MLFLMILIYFIILIIIEFFFIINSKKKDNFIEIENVHNIDKLELKLKETNDNLFIENYKGKLLVKNNYGFFNYFSQWNMLEENKLYNFKLPVNINLIKVNDNELIQYLIN